MKKMNKLLAMLLAIVTVVSIVPMASANYTTVTVEKTEGVQTDTTTSTAPADKTFPDVNPADWFYTDVMAMAEQGIIEGYTDGTYKPNDPVTHAEFASLLAKAFYGTDLKAYENGEDGMKELLVKRLTYVPTDWWFSYSHVLDDNDIWGNAGNEMFFSYEYVDEEVEAMADWNVLLEGVQRTADKEMNRNSVIYSVGAIFQNEEARARLETAFPALATTEDVYGIYPKLSATTCAKYDAMFTDWSDIAEMEQWSVAAALELGIIKGNPSGNLNIRSSVTRAEMATIMNRLFNCEYLTADVYEAPVISATTTTPTETTTPAVDTAPNSNVKGYYDNTKYVVPADFNKDSVLTEEEVLQMLDQLQQEFPDQSPLADAIFPTGNGYTLDDRDGIFYRSEVLGHGGDCIAWAYYASDRIFGNLPVVRLRPGQWEETDLRPGDVLERAEHYNMAMNRAFEVADDVYAYQATDSGSGLKITWGGEVSGAPLTLFKNSMTIATRYPQ